MSEILNVKKALERRLLTLSPTVATGFEGVEFIPPTNTMYQRCQFMINSPVDPTFPSGYHREQIQLQVFVCDVKGKGTGAAIARAELIRNLFYKSLSLIEGTTRIHILRTPQIGSAFVTQDRIIVPVIVQVTAEVYQ